MNWRRDPATLRQKSYLVILGFRCPKRLTKGEASDIIDAAKKRMRMDLRRRGLH